MTLASSIHTSSHHGPESPLRTRLSEETRATGSSGRRGVPRLALKTPLRFLVLVPLLGDALGPKRDLEGDLRRACGRGQKAATVGFRGPSGSDQEQALVYHI